MNSEAIGARPKGDRILIVGGYGQVGRSIAERLARIFPHRVTVAGRDLAKARATAAELDYGTEGRAVDIFAADAVKALDDVSLAIVCLDQRDTGFVQHCLSHGTHYIDISADHAFLSNVERLDDVARRNGSTAVLSVGVAPGLTNMLAARARERMERTDRIDIVLEIGLGDHHGRAAVEWMLDNLDVTYEVREGGQPKSVRSFGESIKVSLPGQRADRSAYRFNFADQHVIWHTLEVPTVSTWIRFDGRFSTWLVAVSSRFGLGRLLRSRRWRSLATWLFTNIHWGSDTCGIAVRATGRTEAGADSLTLGLIGRKEALMTAIVTAETARQILSGHRAPGVHHSEQVIALGPVVSALKNELSDLVVAL